MSATVSPGLPSAAAPRPDLLGALVLPWALRPRLHPWRLAVLAIALATLARLALVPFFPNGAPFAAYFPALVLVSLGGGLKPGAFALGLSILAGNLLFMGDHRDIGVADAADVFSICAYALTAAPVVWVGARLRASLARKQTIIRELNHRTRNVLAVTNSIIRLSARDGTRAEYEAAISGRIAALARAHTLLADAHWGGADLASIIRGEVVAALGPLGDARLVRLAGPPVPLPHAMVQPLAGALHELATNAVRHGSLSGPGGTVFVGWRLNRATGRLRLRWTERGGPEPVEPARLGFGLRVVDATVRGQLQGSIKRHWRAAGLSVEAEMPCRAEDGTKGGAG